MVALMGATLTFTGCVTTQQYEALQSQLDEAESENASLRLARQDAQVSSRELEGQVARLTTENDALAEDANTLDTGGAKRFGGSGASRSLERRLDRPEFWALERHRRREPSIAGGRHENPGGIAGA